MNYFILSESFMLIWLKAKGEALTVYRFIHAASNGAKDKDAQ